MSLWDYEIFDLIVRTKSLRKASEIMHLTPSAVSHSLQKLEKEFGLSLLIRGRTGIELTVYGREILPFIRTILAKDKELYKELDSIKGVLSGSVRIGVINSICCCWMPAIIQQMHREHPDISVQIVQGGYDDLELGLFDGTLDLAFVSIPTRRSLTPIPLFRDRLLCITSTGFVPENDGYITLDEIRRQEIIIPGAGSDFDAISFMQANGLRQETPHNIIEDSSIIALVESGLGISIMPELVLRKVRGDIHIYPIESAPYRSIGIASRQSDFVSPSAAAMLKIILDYVLREYPSEIPYFQERPI